MNGPDFLHLFLQRMTKLLRGDELIKEHRPWREAFVHQKLSLGSDRVIHLDGKIGEKIQRAWNETTYQFARIFPPPRRGSTEKVETPEDAAEAIFKLSLENPFFGARVRKDKPIPGQHIQGWKREDVQSELAYKLALNNLIDLFLLRLMLNEGLSLDLHAYFAHLSSMAAHKRWTPKEAREQDTRKEHPRKTGGRMK